MSLHSRDTNVSVFHFISTYSYGKTKASLFYHQLPILPRFTETEIYVRVGEYDFDTNNETKFIDLQVEKIISHQLYDKTLHKNDMALVKLSGLVEYTRYTRPICLPPAGYQVQVNQTAFIAGKPILSPPIL